jgi:dienelactone hydrolase
MTYRHFPALVLVTALTLSAGCSKAPAPDAEAQVPGGEAKPGAAEQKQQPVEYPELSKSRTIQPGVLFQEASLEGEFMPMRVWFYRPEKSADRLALVLVPPAGSTLMAGMDLSDGDRAEHFPYVKAGFAVASFEIDGNVPANFSQRENVILRGARQFKSARAGLDNEKLALDFILAKVPEIDPNRIFIAGHSSAATLALLAAAHDPRIKACAAYAPVADVEKRLAAQLTALDKVIPGYKEFIRASSPKTHADKLKCPIFLFHAKDDRNVPVRETTDFAEQLKKTNPAVTLVIAARGGHAESMIVEGMPKGIEWLKKLK